MPLPTPSVPEPSAASVRRLAECMTDGPVTADTLAMARAQLGARPPLRIVQPPRKPELTKDQQVADDLLGQGAEWLDIIARGFRALAAFQSPRLQAQIMALAGSAETLISDIGDVRAESGR